MDSFICKEMIMTYSLSCIPLFATPWTVAHQAPLSVGFSRQEYWSGLPCPSPGNLPHPDQGSNPGLLNHKQILYLSLQADSLLSSHQGSPIYQQGIILLSKDVYLKGFILTSVFSWIL